MFPAVRNWADARRSPRTNLRLGAALAFVAGAANAGGFRAVGLDTSHMTGIVSSMADNLALWEITMARVVADRHKLRVPGLLVGMFLVGGLVGALGFKRIGYSMTAGLAAILLPISLQPFIDDLRIRYRLSRRRR